MTAPNEATPSDEKVEKMLDKLEEKWATPRTDAEVSKIAYDTEVMEAYAFARQLERELAAERESRNADSDLLGAAYQRAEQAESRLKVAEEALEYLAPFDKTGTADNVLAIIRGEKLHDPT